MKPLVSKKIRNAARGEQCLVRIPGVCDGGGETTVLAHYRMAGYCGAGIKPGDFAFGAFCCARCHDAVDGRARIAADRDILRLYHAEGVMRTQSRLVEMGIITVR